MNKNRYYGFYISLGIILSYLFIFSISPKKAQYLTIEDGIIETCQAVCYALSSAIFFYFFVKSESETELFIFGASKNYFFLFLSIFSFICFGEEVSWGQRIFEIETPKWLEGKNTQSEINLHNIDTLFYIQGIRISSGRIFLLFWVSFFILIPILNRISGKVQLFFEKLRFPVIPIYLVLPFLINYIIFELIHRGFIMTAILPFYMEIYELNFALLFLACFTFPFFRHRKTDQWNLKNIEN